MKSKLIKWAVKWIRRVAVYEDIILFNYTAGFYISEGCSDFYLMSLDELFKSTFFKTKYYPYDKIKLTKVKTMRKNTFISIQQAGILIIILDSSGRKLLIKNINAMVDLLSFFSYSAFQIMRKDYVKNADENKNISDE